MSDDFLEIGPTQKFFKEKLRLETKQLTLEYMKKQNQKIESEKKWSEIEKEIRKSEFPVLVLGDNEKEGTPSSLLEDLQKSVGAMGFVCGLGSHIHNFSKGRFESEVEDEMFEPEKLPRLIILVNGRGPGTIGEAKRISSNEVLNDRTLFFFDHEEDFNALVDLAKNKKFPIDFKYPIPYHEEEELTGKTLFGVLHCFYRYWRYKRPKEMGGQ